MYIVILLLLASCGAGSSSGARNLSNHDEACEPENHQARSTFACEYDSECGMCHDGSDCGTIMSTEEIARRGAACEQPDAAECELATARCCAGRCVVAGYAGD